MAAAAIVLVVVLVVVVLVEVLVVEVAVLSPFSNIISTILTLLI